MGSCNMRIKDNHESIIFIYEGYEIKIIVSYHSNISGIYLSKLEIVPTPRQIVNKQQFYNHLSILRSEISDGKHSDAIKFLLIKKLNSNQKKTAMIIKRNRLLTTMLLASIISLIILGYISNV